MITEIFLLQNPWRKNTNYSFHLRSRDIFTTLTENMDNELIIGLIGSRQVGKSSLIYLLIEDLLRKGIQTDDIFYFNLDDLSLHALFSDVAEFIQFLGSGSSRKYIFIDEIQRLPSPGLFLKEIFDLHKNIKLVYSGSSQLEVKAKTKEHLVGRVRVFTINRLSFDEYLNFAAPITKKDALHQILLYGAYPAIAKASGSMDKKLRIKDIFQSYVQKDLIDFIQLKYVDKYNKFLIQAAMLNGNLLNVHTLSKSLGISRNMVEEFISILEQTFICKRIYPFHNNYSKEIVKTPKLYFLDIGLRNFILNNFNNLDLRTDVGSLFENFILTELISKDYYSLLKVNFWRTTNKTEIDFIVWGEERFEAIEVKWKSKKRPRVFTTIETLYPKIKTMVISADNYYKL